MHFSGAEKLGGVAWGRHERLTAEGRDLDERRREGGGAWRRDKEPDLRK